MHGQKCKDNGSDIPQLNCIPAIHNLVCTGKDHFRLRPVLQSQDHAAKNKLVLWKTLTGTFAILCAPLLRLRLKCLFFRVPDEGSEIAVLPR
jgi:hypothetical protein